MAVQALLLCNYFPLGKTSIEKKRFLSGIARMMGGGGGGAQGANLGGEAT